MKKLLQENSLLWLALALALFGSLTHVAWAFSTLESGSLTLGYVQALAVDVGLFAIAVGIQRNRRGGLKTRGLWGGVLFFAFISTYANLLHGLVFSSDLPLEGDALWLAGFRPILLSAVLPILVVYLAEVAAGRLRETRETDYYTNDGELLKMHVPTSVLAAEFLEQWYNSYGREPETLEMVERFEQATGRQIEAGQADEFITSLRSRRGIVGRRPSTPTPGAMGVNGRG